MTDITIPPGALEAAARAIEAADVGMTPSYEEAARAACLAMIRAWPGMHIHEWHRPWLGGMSGTDIILPIITENTNAEA